MVESINPENLRKCSKCEEHFPLSFYYFKNKEKTRLRTWCKSCCLDNNVKNKNKFKNKRFIYQNKYYSKNKETYTCYRNNYRATKMNAFPKWLSKEQVNQIKQIYKDVKEIQWLSEEKFEVDHIIPLQGKNVCGLHVPWNLQIITASANRIKGNR